jgi:hypothetical protein
MAKIHTHYDNLKVSRGAPPEVIRAAYKALSQKYHPDKNPGDEKAARIMAIVNTAYNCLSDPERRKEHDEWIAAEEWEVEWLESTRHEDHGHGHGPRPARAHEPDHAWHAEHPPQGVRAKAARDPRWWAALGLVFGVGCIAGAVAVSQQSLLPQALAAAWNGNGAPAPVRAEIPARAAASVRPREDARPAAVADNWAVAREGAVRAAAVHTVGVAALLIPPRVPECELDMQVLSAPNGAAWPDKTGYLEGYPLANQGGEMVLNVDNSANPSPVFVKVYDVERRANVRHLYVEANDAMTVDGLAKGRYEVRYQNLEAGGSPDCPPRRPQALKQAAITP